MIEALAWCSAFVSLAGTVMTFTNLAEFPMLRGAAGVRRSVVACVAMRNEADNAEGCITSLLRQPEIAAIVVVDDASEDGTGDIIERLATTSPRVIALRLQGATGGKRTALACAAAAARQFAAPYLVFCDADVRLRAGALGGMFGWLVRRNVQAVTGWPSVEPRSLWDRRFGALLIGLLLALLPMRLGRGVDPRFSAGNGQLFLVERASYERCGGHAALSSVLEDVGLARALKQNGARVGLCSAARIATVRGYGSFAENVRGYGRSLYYGAGLGGVLAYGVWQFGTVVLPWFLFCTAPVPSVIAMAAALSARCAVACRSDEAWLYALLAPIEGLCATLAALAASCMAMRGGFLWRGRRPA